MNELKEYYEFKQITSKGQNITRLVPDATLLDMLEAFEGFLKASGFCFDGNVDIVEEEEGFIEPEGEDD